MKTIISDELAKKIPAAVFEIFDKFLKENKEIYLVGGAVRDLLLGKIPLDCDFTTNASPQEIQKILPDSFYENIFGTVGLIVDEPASSALRRDGRGKQKYEITTYRGEQGYSDNRRPDKVWWSENLEDDLKRRDFTINAMAIGPVQNQKSKIKNQNCGNDLELIDLFNGEKDLENKLIRAVGNPIERFSEDALRMMRAIRFSSQLGFLIEENTFSAIIEKSDLLKNISKERIKEELFKILKSDYPADGIVLLFNSKLLDLIIPQLIKGYGMKQAKHHIYDVWNHSLMSLKNCPSPDPLVRLATLIHDVGKPIVARGEGENRTFYNHEVIGASIAKNIAKDLKFSKKEEEKLITLVRWHQFTVDERQTDSAIRRFIKNVGKENITDMLALRTGDRLGGGARETSWRLEEYKKRIEEVQVQPFSVADLKINGNDIMEILKINPGPKIGEILNQIFKEVEEKGLQNEREILLEKIKEY